MQSGQGKTSGVPLLRFSNVSFWYDENEPPVLYRLSFRVEPGQIVCILGASGSGKSTCLRLAAGLVQGYQGAGAFRGSIEWASGRPPGPGDVAYVPQDYEATLSPAGSVLGAVADATGLKSKAAEVRARELLASAGLSAGQMHRRGAELSGGQAQRVALCVAIASQPRLLLLDEPFASLDFQTRDAVTSYLRAVVGTGPAAAVIVTHDVRGAVELGSHVLAFGQGRHGFESCAFEEPHGQEGRIRRYLSGSTT